MKKILCYIFGHKWVTLSKIPLSVIADKMNKEYWWSSKHFYVGNDTDFFVINRQCSRCDKFENNIDEARKLVRSKILN